MFSRSGPKARFEGKNRLGLCETWRSLAGAELGEFSYGTGARQRLGG